MIAAAVTVILLIGAATVWAFLACLHRDQAAHWANETDQP